MNKCKKCGSDLKHYDYVRRIVRGTNGKSRKIFVERVYCKQCGSVIRVLPDILYPYKQYEKSIVDGFVDGRLSSSMIEFEDYPTDLTVKRWKQSRNFYNPCNGKGYFSH